MAPDSNGFAVIVWSFGRVAVPLSFSDLRPLAWAAFFWRRAYNARVDRLNAIRLLKALVAAGANTRAPMANIWVHSLGMTDLALEETDLAAALAYAEGEGWLADSPRKGWISLTRTGEVVAKAK